jgi:proteasome lid subunit RPN8/RPN11
MAIRLSTDQIRAIKQHGERTFPHECCGFLLGSAVNGTKQTAVILAVENAHDEENQHNRFLITSDMYLRADLQARERNLDVIGFYHSHPNAPARPSQYDTDHGWAWYSYVIVAVADGCSQRVTSWVLRDDRSQFDEEKILNGDI